MTQTHEINDYCKEKFAALEDIQKTQNQQNVEVGILGTKLDSLTDSLKGLINALWGITSVIIVTLVGFFIWYVQTK